MTSAAAPAPKSQTGLQIHLLLVVLSLAALVLQVYFAGRGIFGGGFDAHEILGGVLHLVALILLVVTVAVSATRNGVDIGHAAGFLVLVFVSPIFADLTSPSAAAFHPVLALLMLGLVFSLLARDRRRLAG